MTELQERHHLFRFGRDDLTQYSEADLLTATRLGKSEAFGELWVRHERVALGVARRISSADADDLVAEAFARVLRALRAGKGPTENFRAYLCSTVRACAVDQFRRAEAPTVAFDEPAMSDRAALADDPGERGDEAVQAWKGLSEQQRWLLWANAVEGYDVTEIADKLGAKPGTVAVWLFRARERLRAAFLEGHVEPSENAVCQVQRERFVPYLRGTLSTRRRAPLEAHLTDCLDCTRALAAAGCVNHEIRVVIWPLLPIAVKLGFGSAPLAWLGARLHLQGAASQVAAAKVAVIGTATATAAAAVATAVVISNPGVAPARVVAGPPPSAIATANPEGAKQSASAKATTPAQPLASPTTSSPASATPAAPSAEASPSVTASGVTPPLADQKVVPPADPPADPPINPLAAPPPNPPTCAGQLLTDPGFEGGGSGWSATDGVFWNDGQYARSGQGWAWLAGQPVPVTETLSQTVDVPAGCQVTLTYWLRVYSGHTGTPTDTLTLRVNGNAVQAFTNADHGFYVQRTVDLSSYAGGSVTITWTAVQTTNQGTSFWIDDCALDVT